MAVGDTTITWFGQQVFVAATKQNIKAMKDATYEVEKHVVNNFTVPGTGNTYKRSKGKKNKRTKYHRASLPGQPPSVDEGILRGSIDSFVDTKESVFGRDRIDGRVGPDIDKIRAKAEAGTDVEYGYYLEVGTKNMRARPYLVPALRACQKKIKKIFVDANK